MKRIFIFSMLFLISFITNSQNLKYRSVDYYFSILKKAEIKESQDRGLLDGNLNIAKKYKKKAENGLNQAGQDLYLNIKMNLLKTYFKDYLYQQHINYKNETYVLYFSMAGFDDTEWCILKWKRGKWKNLERIDKQLVENVRNKKDESANFNFVCFNYDEGPKNIDGIKIFVKKHYLIMQRGGLYHSLIDLEHDKILINEESPMHACNSKNKTEMNIWIKKNLHDKIGKIIQ